MKLNYYINIDLFVKLVKSQGTLITHGNQFSKIINSEMVVLKPITINNHFNNANYVTKVDHLCSERHTFNFLLKKVDFRADHGNFVEYSC